MKDNKKMSAIYSWPWIIFFIIVFWPIGVFLIYKRVSFDRKTALSGDKTVKKLAIVSYVLAALGFIGIFVTDNDSINAKIGVFFGIAAVVLHIISRKMKAEADTVKQYLAILVNENEKRLDSIASSTGKTYDVVRADIQKMIEKGFLKNVRIDDNIREIVVVENKEKTSAPGTDDAANNSSRVVACSCCGASNRIQGETGECEYCGSPIQ